jgi:hypothetical protein
MGHSDGTRLVVIVVSHGVLARCRASREADRVQIRAVPVIGAEQACNRTRPALRPGHPAGRKGSPPGASMASRRHWLSGGTRTAAGLRGAQPVSDALSRERS